MKTLTLLACAAALALPFTFATAQGTDVPLPDLTNEQIEAEYLACERQASEAMLGFDMAAHCSIIFEAFKARAFDGDFERLLAWWRERRIVAADWPEP